MNKRIEIIWLSSCKSTNDEAWLRFSVNPKGPILVLTENQTEGRGTQGRLWKSSTQDLKVSLAFLPKNKNLLWIPVAAGIATVECIANLKEASNLEDLHLKWPNDIYFGNAKMGGLLCESKIRGQELLGTVVGLGLNLLKAPIIENAPADYKTVALFESVLAKVPTPKNIKKWQEDFAITWANRLLGSHLLSPTYPATFAQKSAIFGRK